MYKFKNRKRVERNAVGRRYDRNKDFSDQRHRHPSIDGWQRLLWNFKRTCPRQNIELPKFIVQGSPARAHVCVCTQRGARRKPTKVLIIRPRGRGPRRTSESTVALDERDVSLLARVADRIGVPRRVPSSRCTVVLPRFPCPFTSPNRRHTQN